MGESFSDKMNAASGFLSSVLLVLQTRLKGTLAGMLSLDIGDPMKARERIGVISTMMDVLKTLVDTVKGFNEFREEGKTLSSADLVNIIQTVGGVFSPYAMTRLRDLTERLSTGVGDPAVMSSAMKNAESLTAMTDRALDAAVKMNRLNDVAAAMPMYASVDEMPAVSVITALVDEANALDDLLSDLKPVNLQAKLEKFADTLGFSKKDIMVKQGNVNLMINLDVTMDAAELVKVLSEHGVVSTQTTKR